MLFVLGKAGSSKTTSILKTIKGSFVCLAYTHSAITALLLLNAVKDALDFIVQYAAGNPGRALQIASDDAFKQIRQEASDWFFKIPTASRTDLLVEGIKYIKNSKDQINLILDLWQDLIRDILVLMENIMTNVSKFQYFLPMII